VKAKQVHPKNFVYDHTTFKKDFYC